MGTYWIQTALLILVAFIIGLVLGKLLRKLFCRPVKHFDYGRSETGEDSTYHKPNYGPPKMDKNRKSHLDGAAVGAGAAGAVGLAAALNTDGPEAEVKDVELDVDVPDAHFPEAKFSDFSMKEAEMDAEMSKIDVDLPSTKLEAPDVDLPSTDIKIPEVDVTMPEIKNPNTDLPSADLNKPDVDIKLPDVDLPSADLDMPNVDVKLPDVDLPSADLDMPDMDMKVPDVNIPNIASKVPDVDLPSVDLNTPDVDIKTPEIDLPSVEAGIPDVGADVSLPEAQEGIGLDDLAKGAVTAAGAVGAGIAAKIGLGKDENNVDVTVESPDIKMPNLQVNAPDVEINAEVAGIKTPEIDLKADTDTPDINADLNWPRDEDSNKLTGIATGTVAAVATTAVSGIIGTDSADAPLTHSVQQSLVELIRAEMALPASASTVRLKVLELDDCRCDELELAAENEITLTAGGKGKLSKVPCEVTASEQVVVNQKYSRINSGQIALFLDAGIVVCRQDHDYTFAKL